MKASQKAGDEECIKAALQSQKGTHRSHELDITGSHDTHGIEGHEKGHSQGQSPKTLEASLQASQQDMEDEPQEHSWESEPVGNPPVADVVIATHGQHCTQCDENRRFHGIDVGWFGVLDESLW